MDRVVYRSVDEIRRGAGYGSHLVLGILIRDGERLLPEEWRIADVQWIRVFSGSSQRTANKGGGDGIGTSICRGVVWTIIIHRRLAVYIGATAHITAHIRNRFTTLHLGSLNSMTQSSVSLQEEQLSALASASCSSSPQANRARKESAIGTCFMGDSLCGVHQFIDGRRGTLSLMFFQSSPEKCDHLLPIEALGVHRDRGRQHGDKSKKTGGIDHWGQWRNGHGFD